MLTYTVKAGDTLSKIARKFGLGLDAIIQLNGIRNPDRIRVGQVLQIPATTTDGMDGSLPPPPTPPPGGASSINQTRFRLPVREFIPETIEKDLVVLHFTAGRTAKSAFHTWMNNPARVATSYIVDRDGTIFELFDPGQWAFHLGIKGTNGRHDKRSVGIEIANVGPLKPSPTNPDVLNWWPNDWRTKWCTRDQTEKYVEATYRGIDFFAAFPDEQIDAVAQLVHTVCERFGVPKKIPAAANRAKFDLPAFSKYTGIASHQNFRKDKWDVGPAFPWERLGL